MAASKGFSHHLIFDKLILKNLDTKKRKKWCKIEMYETPYIPVSN